MRTEKVFVHLVILGKNTTHRVVYLWVSFNEPPDLVRFWQWFLKNDRRLGERRSVDEADYRVQLAFRVDDTMFRPSTDVNVNLR